MYFHLKPQSALISDCNPTLIKTYAQVRSNWRKVEQALRRHHRLHSEKYYYEERARTHRVAHEQAAQFIYLNRTCWNGLYRVNLRGEFNVPIGTKSSVTLETDDFKRISSQLKRATLTHSDFSHTINEAKRGDFLFIDPPYVTRHNFNGFVKYNDNIFSWNDQERLADCVVAAASRGAKILLTNADHASVRNLYRGVGAHHSVSRHSVLAADSNNRGTTTELAVTINFDANI